MIVHPRTLPLPHLRRVSEGSQGAGNNWSYDGIVRTHMELLSIMIEFTTDATVSNRRLRLIYGTAIQDDISITSQYPHPASTSVRYSFLKGIGELQTLPYDGDLFLPLPNDIILANPEAWRTEIVNLQAGDEITAVRYRLLQWHDPVWIG